MPETLSRAGAIAALSLTLLFTVATVSPAVFASATALTVNTQTQGGTTLTGYWVEVTTTTGAVVQSGFSPAQFALGSGSYIAYAGDYGGQYFNHWSDGTTSRGHPITVSGTGTASLTAIYCPAQGCGGSTVYVQSQYVNGSALNGMFATLSQNGNVLASGFTPVAFSTNSGQTYSVAVSDYTHAYFNHWSNGYSLRTMSVTATVGTTSLLALYTSGQQPPPPTNESITVLSSDLNGTVLGGFFVDLRVNGNHVTSGFTPVTFTNLQIGVQYGVVIYWYGNHYFRHFSNGNLNRYALVTLNSTAGQNSVTLTGLYQLVPKSQAAALDIIAELPNGTVIGTSSVNSGGYIQHSPGMWLDIIPPGGTVPFTGTFTGGSILPFILFNLQTYTVQMTPGYKNYQFAYWKDTGSTNPDRSVTMNGNATYIAVYNYL